MTLLTQCRVIDVRKLPTTLKLLYSYATVLFIDESWESKRGITFGAFHAPNLFFASTAPCLKCGVLQSFKIHFNFNHKTNNTLLQWIGLWRIVILQIWRFSASHLPALLISGLYSWIENITLFCINCFTLKNELALPSLFLKCHHFYFTYSQCCGSGRFILDPNFSHPGS